MTNKKNNKYKYLLKNIGFLTLSNFGSKILSFILIPLYTNILSTSEYGIYDIFSTTVSLLIPILTLNIMDGIMRFSIDNLENHKEVFSIGVKTCTKSIIILILFLIINKMFNILPVYNEYILYFIGLFVVEVIYTLLSKFARGIEKVKEVSIAGVLNSISVLSLNVLFLVIFKYGLKGYFLANILSYIIPSLYLIIKIKAHKYISLKNYNNDLKNRILKYSKPLIFSNLSWWIINVSDRYMISFSCGIEANGIYSISYKIPSILNIFQSIFNQAWNISAVKEYNEKSNSFYEHIYSIYNFGMVITCSVLIIFDKLISKILFAKNFYDAWMYAPLLMLAVVFGALIGVFNGIFSATKEMKNVSNATMCGAIINIIGNFVFIKIFGVIGAAISTLLSYVFIWLFCYIKLKHKIKFKINFGRDCISYLLLLIQIVVLFINIKLKYIIECILLIMILSIYFSEIIQLSSKIILKVKSKLKGAK